MIQFSEQYKIISKIWQTFKNNKISIKVRMTKEDLEYAKIHYRPKKFENYTLDNFKSLVIYIMYIKNPVSKTDLLSMINEIQKEDLLNSLRFKNDIVNFNNTLKKDNKLINNLTDKETNVYLSYKNKEISIIGFYVFYNNKKLTGRILKKDFKTAKILLELYNIDLSKVQEIK